MDAGDYGSALFEWMNTHGASLGRLSYERALRLRRIGHSWAALAQRAGITTHQVRKWRRKHGLA